MKARGLLLEAEYEGSKFRKWDARDKADRSKVRTFRTLTHRFKWETDNGDEQFHVVEWLPDGSPAEKLADCTIPYRSHGIYFMPPRGIKEEGGIKIGSISDAKLLGFADGFENLATDAVVSEEPGATSR